MQLASRVVTCSEQDAACRLHLTNDVACGWCAHNSVVTEDESFDPIGSTDLDNELHDLMVPVTAIAANHEKTAIRSFRNGQQTTGNEGLAVIGLLEDLDLFAKPGTARHAQVRGALMRR